MGRNAIIHAYFNVDLTIVWRTVQDDLPKLKQQIHQLFTDRQSSSKAAKLAAIAETRAETERSTAHGRQRGKGRT